MHKIKKSLRRWFDEKCDINHYPMYIIEGEHAISPWSVLDYLPHYGLTSQTPLTTCHLYAILSRQLTCSSNCHCPFQSDHPPYVEKLVVVRHVLSTGYTEDLHTRVILQTSEQLRGDQEILARVFVASNLDHAFVDHAFITWIHALIDLIDNTERRPCE
jgi:hypothetical protein